MQQQHTRTCEVCVANPCGRNRTRRDGDGSSSVGTNEGGKNKTKTNNNTRESPLRFNYHRPLRCVYVRPGSELVSRGAPKHSSIIFANILCRRPRTRIHSRFVIHRRAVSMVGAGRRCAGVAGWFRVHSTPGTDCSHLGTGQLRTGTTGSPVSSSRGGSRLRDRQHGRHSPQSANF